LIGNVIEGGITEQTHQSLANIVEVLKASGSGLDKVVKTTVFLKDMNDFVAMNEVYAKVQKYNKTIIS
jgi:2-iminobutanoate/2-iminopropanoate deaminase